MSVELQARLDHLRTTTASLLTSIATQIQQLRDAGAGGNAPTAEELADMDNMIAQLDTARSNLDADDIPAPGVATSTNIIR